MVNVKGKENAVFSLVSPMHRKRTHTLNTSMQLQNNFAEKTYRKSLFNCISLLGARRFCIKLFLS